MESDQNLKSRETGIDVWKTFESQLAEGEGFLSAMFGAFRNFWKKHLLYVLVFGMVASALSAGYFFLKKPTYEAEMTVSYVHYEKKIYADMLVKLNLLISTNNYEELSKQLHLPEEEVMSIKAIQSFNIRREVLTEDISTEKIPFYIVVQLSNLDNLDTLEAALVDYLNGTEFVQDRLAFMEQKCVKELAFLEQRLAVADSLSRMMIVESDNSNDKKTITRMELLEETMAIYSRIQAVEGLLNFNVNIEVLDGFVATQKPIGNGLQIFLLYGFLAGVALRLLVLLFK